MVQKSDGGYGYDSTDMAAIRYRVDVQKATLTLPSTLNPNRSPNANANPHSDRNANPNPNLNPWHLNHLPEY